MISCEKFNVFIEIQNSVNKSVNYCLNKSSITKLKIDTIVPNKRHTKVKDNCSTFRTNRQLLSEISVFAWSLSFIFLLVK